MFEIDKAKFGAFVAQLRKEKGLMQKELAEKLYISDKAVSKWERGLSIPDVALLVPLAEILGITVTELLECRRLPKDEPMDSQQTEEIVKKVIGLSEEEQRKYRPDRLKRGLQLLLCVSVGALEIWILTMLGYSMVLQKQRAVVEIIVASVQENTDAIFVALQRKDANNLRKIMIAIYGESPAQWENDRFPYVE